MQGVTYCFHFLNIRNVCICITKAWTQYVGSTITKYEIREYHHNHTIFKIMVASIFQHTHVQTHTLMFACAMGNSPGLVPVSVFVTLSHIFHKHTSLYIHPAFQRRRLQHIVSFIQSFISLLRHRLIFLWFGLSLRYYFSFAGLFARE